MNAAPKDHSASHSASAISRRVALSGVAGMSLAALLARRWAPASAQDATPTGPVGISIQMLGSGPTTIAPGYDLTLRYTVLAPGGRLPSHTHPGALVIYVQSGSFGYTALGGTVQLTRAAIAGTPSPPEVMPIGTEVILTAGDWVFVEESEDDIRNAGDDDVVLLVAGLNPAGVPFTTFMPEMDMEATPAS